MVRKKIIIIFCIISMVFIGNVIIRSNSFKKIDELSVDYEICTLKDFVIKKDKVYFTCYITVKNNSKYNKKFMMKGDFVDDAQKKKEKALLKQRYLVAIEEGEDNLFEIGSNSEKGYNVVFIGEFAGKKTKSNRLMPKIILEEK